MTHIRERFCTPVLNWRVGTITTREDLRCSVLSVDGNSIKVAILRRDLGVYR
jgi:sRNA-binding carbon storage regulator CsrA